MATTVPSLSAHLIPWDALVAFRAPNVFNPWAEDDPLDLDCEGVLKDSPPVALPGPGGRRARLEAHFAGDIRLILAGEAVGYQGCHFSGIAFTNERLLLEGRIPRIKLVGRITRREKPWSEPSATVVWSALHEHGLADRTALWNAFAWHPYKPGEPYSNRAPTEGELQAGRDVLAAMLDAVPDARVVADGKVAARLMKHLGRTPSAELRHPSMGGASEFRAGLKELAKVLR